MGDRTEIAWTDATWNPIRGCSRVSEGCRNCYAERVAARFSGPGMPYEGLARMRVQTTEIGPRGAPYGDSEPRWTGEVRLIEEHLADPLRWRKPRRIFVNSMSDLFHEKVPDEWIDRIFAVMALAPRHTFQVLTKRPERMRAWFERKAARWPELEPIPDVPLNANVVLDADVSAPEFVHEMHARECDWPAAWPLPNVWLGVSVEGPDHRDRIDVLRQVPAAVRFVSFEPLLADLRDFRMDGIAWAIFGGESGPGARSCDIDWIRSGIATCRYYGTACFVKQFGARPETRATNGDLVERILLRDRKGADPEEWPEDLRVREFPAALQPRP